MSESVSTMEIEDILSSIRTLVSSDINKARPEAEMPGKLVLTSDLRVEGAASRSALAENADEDDGAHGDASAEKDDDFSALSMVRDPGSVSRPPAAGAGAPLVLDQAKRRDRPQLHDVAQAAPKPMMPAEGAENFVAPTSSPERPEAPQALHTSGMREDFDEAPYFDDRELAAPQQKPRQAASFRIVGGTEPERHDITEMPEDDGFEEGFALDDLETALAADRDGPIDDVETPRPEADSFFGGMTLEQRIAELEAAVTAQAFDFEPDGSEDGAQHRPTSILRLATGDEKPSERTGPEERASEWNGREDAGPRLAPRRTRVEPGQGRSEEGIAEGAELLGAHLSGPLRDAGLEDDEAGFPEPEMTARPVQESVRAETPRPRRRPEPEASADDERAWIAEAIRSAALGRAARKEAVPERVSKVHRFGGAGETDMAQDDPETTRARRSDRAEEPQDVELLEAETLRSNSFHSRGARRAETPVEPPAEAEESAYLDEEALRDMVAEIVRQELQGALGERITRNVRKLVRREIMRAVSIREFD